MAAPSPARRAAAQILMAVESREAWASELLRARGAGLSPADRALASELVLGVLRRRQWLDHRLNAVLAPRGWSVERLDSGLRAALRLGLYQLIWLERIPAAVAVDQSVGLARVLRLASGAGLVNAVLRNCARASDLRAASALWPGPADWNDSGFQAWLSHPPWLLSRWRARFGEAAAREIAIYDNAAPPLHLCFHPGLDPERVLGELASQGVVAEPLWLRGAWVVRSGEATAVESFRCRRYWIQTAASQFMAWLLLAGAPAVPADGSVDACAAPGGKAALLAAAGGPVLAIELHWKRAVQMRRRFPAVAGVPESPAWPGLHAVAADAARGWPAASAFSRILLDAPCTGSGTLARNPELRWRLQPSDPPRLAELQARLLASALRQAAPGARLLYSVCSLEPEEGEQLIARALETLPAWRPLSLAPLAAAMLQAGRLHRLPSGAVFSGPFLSLPPGPETGAGFFAAMLARD